MARYMKAGAAVKAWTGEQQDRHEGLTRNVSLMRTRHELENLCGRNFCKYIFLISDLRLLARIRVKDCWREVDLSSH